MYRHEIYNYVADIFLQLASLKDTHYNLHLDPASQWLSEGLILQLLYVWATEQQMQSNAMVILLTENTLVAHLSKATV